MTTTETSSGNNHSNHIWEMAVDSETLSTLDEWYHTWQSGCSCLTYTECQGILAGEKQTRHLCLLQWKRLRRWCCPIATDKSLNPSKYYEKNIFQVFRRLDKFCLDEDLTNSSSPSELLFNYMNYCLPRTLMKVERRCHNKAKLMDSGSSKRANFTSMLPIPFNRSHQHLILINRNRIFS